MPDPDTFFTALLQKMNMTASPWRLEFFRKWTNFESGYGEWAADWNPLNTTFHMPGDRDLGNDPTQNGGNPVREYPDFNTGVEATFRTLTNGLYVGIIRALLFEKIGVTCPANLRVWGSVDFANLIDGGWEPVSTVPPAVPIMTLEQRIGRLEALVAGNGARAKDGTVLQGEAALRDQSSRGNSVMLGLSLGQDRDAEIASALAGILSGTATFEAVLDALQKIIDKAKK